MLTQYTSNDSSIKHTPANSYVYNLINIFQNCMSWIPKSTVWKKISQQLGWIFIAIFNIFSITVYTHATTFWPIHFSSGFLFVIIVAWWHQWHALTLSSWVMLKACCLMGTKPLPGQIHTTCNKWFAISKLTHCRLVTPYGARDLVQHWLR